MHEPILLRALSVGEIIDGAIGFYRRNFGPTLAIAAVVQAPLVALEAAAAIGFTGLVAHNRGGALPWSDLAPSAGVFLAAVLLVTVLRPLGEAALAVAVSERHVGRRIGVLRAYRAALAKWPRVLWTGLLYWGLVYVLAGLAAAVLVGPLLIWMPVGGGVLALSGPRMLLPPALGLLLCAAVLVALAAAAVRYMPAPAIVVALEGGWGLAAMRRSARLTRGHGRDVFVVMAVLLLLVAVVTFGLSAPVRLLTLLLADDATRPASAQAIYQIVAGTLAVLLRPLCMVGAVLVYYDLRVRKEGFDLQMLAEALEPGPEAGEVPQARARNESADEGDGRDE